MLERIRILVMLQLSNVINLKFKNDKRLLTKTALTLLIMIIATIITNYVMMFFEKFLFITININFAIFIILVTQVISIVANTSTLINDLYNSKDNQILLSLPVNLNEIFISKLIVFYIKEYIRNLFYLVPLLLALGKVSGVGIIFYFNFIIILLLMPLLVIIISSILSMILMLVKKLLKGRTLINLIITLFLLISGFIVIKNILDKIPTPIRIVQMYRSFTESLNIFMAKTANKSFIYKYIGYILYNKDVILSYFILVIITLLLTGIIYLTSKYLYFNLAMNHIEFSVRKRKKKIRNNKSLFMTFFNKELKIKLRSLNDLFSNYSTLLLLPIILYILNFVYMNINKSSIGISFVLVFNLIITLLVTLSSNTESASAISVEGYEFILLKTAPSDTKKIAWAKITFNVISSTVILLIGFIIFIFNLKGFNIKDGVLLFLVVFLVNTGHILWSFQLDLMTPQLGEYAQTNSTANNINVKKSLSYSLVLTIIFGSTFMFCLLKYTIIIGWTTLIIMGISFLVFRFLLFKDYLFVYFNEIEF